MTELQGRRTVGREALAELIPHQGAMCLLDRLIEWDADRILLASATHRSEDHPLRAHGRLRALHLCEYGAQAMAVHGGLRAQAAGSHAQPGMLVSLREVRLHLEYLEELPGELVIEARRLLETPGSRQYAFSVQHGGTPLAEGRAAVMIRTPSDSSSSPAG